MSDPWADTGAGTELTDPAMTRCGDPLARGDLHLILITDDATEGNDQP